jgi:predicted tellurium resistance membrane protein TerC
MDFFAWMANPEAWLALGALTAIEIVLGIDNVIFLSILVAKLPRAQQARARQVGLGLAMGMRILLLLSLSWLLGFTQPLFALLGQAISGRDLILIVGGLFLLAKATLEIHGSLEGEEGAASTRPVTSFAAVIVQVVLLDIVFSIDSVLTAVGMANDIPVMVLAIVISVGIMLVAAGAIHRFIEQHPTQLPGAGRRGADGRGPGHAHPAWLHLLRHGLLGGCGDVEHPRAPPTGRAGAPAPRLCRGAAA